MLNINIDKQESVVDDLNEDDDNVFIADLKGTTISSIKAKHDA